MQWKVRGSAVLCASNRLSGLLVLGTNASPLRWLKKNSQGFVLSHIENNPMLDIQGSALTSSYSGISQEFLGC